MEDEEVDFLKIYTKDGVIPENLKKQAVSQRLSSSIRPQNQNASVIKTPAVGLSPAGHSPAVEIQSEKYGSRAKAGDVIFRYKCKDSSYWESLKTSKTTWRVKLLEPSSDLASNDYKYMFQKIKEVATAMDRVVDEIGDNILNELDAQEKRAGLNHTSVEEGLYVGRIRGDMDGKLSSGSAYFEGCLEDSDGHVVGLDLSSVEEYHLFPGQVAVLEGKNELGKCLRVTQINVPKLLPFEETKIDSIADPLNIIVAVGPFTPGDSLQYEPLKDLIKIIKRDKPDICILIGPFIEGTHKMIEAGEISETFEEFFKKQMKHLSNELADQKSQILLVPNYKDIHGHYVYPTPPYPLKTGIEKITVVPDPASVSVNGIVIGITSTDILMHLGRNELANSTISGDRMGRLARHILSQHNFYPLYPSDESVPTDMVHLTRYGRIKVNPHILILPSDLRHFIKDVDGTIVVNPERITKGSSGGTYARIQVDLTSSVENNGKFTSVANSCVGEIIKI